MSTAKISYGTGIYMIGLLSLEKDKIESQIEELVEAVKDRRDYESSVMVMCHTKLKKLATEFVRLTNEIESFRKCPVLN